MAWTLYYQFALIFLCVLTNASTAAQDCHHNCIQEQTCTYQRYTNKCFYLFNNTELGWQETKEFCAKEGFAMVKITKTMLDYGLNISGLFGGIPSPKNQAWLAGKAEDFRQFKFVNNTITSASTLLTTDSPDLISLTKCGEVHTQSSSIAIGIHDCWTKTYFFCRFEGCPVNTDCLQIIQERMTWFEARSHCLTLGGDLFYMKQGESYLFSGLLELPIMDKIQNLNAKIHIGLRGRTWEWTDGTQILYTNWKSNEPNSYSEMCLTLVGDSGKWNDDQCFTEKYPLCIGDFQAEGDTSVLVTSETTQTLPGNVTTVFTATTVNLTDVTTGTPTDGSFCLRNPVAIPILGALLGMSLLVNLAFAIFTLKNKSKTKDQEETSPSSQIKGDEYEDVNDIAEYAKYEDLVIEFKC